MEIALVGLVVVALVLFFVLKKKSGTSQALADSDDAPFTTPSKQIDIRGGEEKAPQHPSRSDAEESDGAEPIGNLADRASEQKESLTPKTEASPSTRDDEPSGPSSPAQGDTGLEPELQSDAEAGEEFASPPPPPHRGMTPTPQTVGNKPGLSSLRKGLAKSRQAEGFFGKLKGLFSGRKEIDPAIAEDIEEVLLSSDVGVQTTEAILDRIKEQLDRGDLKDEQQVWEALRTEAKRTLSVDGRSGGIALRERPTVILMVGVNGAGKTTTIGKLAAQFTKAGQKVVLAAGDTFRAAAVDQLRAWGDRVGCEVIFGKDNADPSSVLFEAVNKAKSNGADVLLADTAGRLHTKANLMAEMTKIQKTIAKALPGAPHEILLVIDSTNGQNAMAQAREFKEALALSGLILTKLDGTARGGAVLGICDALQLPIRYIGVGESAEHLYEFDTDAFVEALLGSENDEVPV